MAPDRHGAGSNTRNAWLFDRVTVWKQRDYIIVTSYAICYDCAKKNHPNIYTRLREAIG